MTSGTPRLPSGSLPALVSWRWLAEAGHTSTSFTQDRYGHLFPSPEDEFAERLAKLVVMTPATADVVPIRAPERASS